MQFRYEEKARHHAMAGPWRIYASLLRACAFAADCLEDHGCGF